MKLIIKMIPVLMAILAIGCSTEGYKIKKLLRDYERAQNRIGCVNRMEATAVLADKAALEQLMDFRYEEGKRNTSVEGQPIIDRLENEVWPEFDRVSLILTVNAIKVNDLNAIAEVTSKYKYIDKADSLSPWLKTMVDKTPQSHEIKLRKDDGKWIIYDFDKCEKTDENALAQIIVAKGIDKMIFPSDSKDRKNESIVEENMHTIQLAAEDFYIETEGIYPVDRWSQTAQGRSFESFWPEDMVNPCNPSDAAVMIRSVDDTDIVWESVNEGQVVYIPKGEKENGAAGYVIMGKAKTPLEMHRSSGNLKLGTGLDTGSGEE
jgi:hypothetical protein